LAGEYSPGGVKEKRRGREGEKFLKCNDKSSPVGKDSASRRNARFTSGREGGGISKEWKAK